ncbi:MAG: hypothetical protein HY361_02760 [Candidatus Aenigmarchaeota archaeon]|nr:hypothetical protein [Candidatus Aenigmarchaeota archaeon]
MAKGAVMEKDSGEFELIPVSPLRKLEKRIDELEVSKGGNMQEFYRDMVDIVKMNQQLVDELAKANDALRIEISRLPSRMEDLIARMDEIISFIKASATEEMAPTAGDMKPLGDKLDQLIETNKRVAESNQSVLQLLDNIGKKLSRPVLPPVKRPFLLQPKPM